MTPTIGRRLLSEHRSHGLNLEFRRQVAISPSHLIAGVTDDIVDDPLISASRREARNHRVSEDMEASHNLPFAAA